MRSISHKKIFRAVRLAFMVLIFIAVFFAPTFRASADDLAASTPGAGFGGTNPQSVGLVNPLSCDNLGCVADAVINFLLDIAFVLVSIMALIGGFQMMTAGGNPEKFTKGRNTLYYAVIGFAVVLVAKGAASIIKSIIK